LLIEETPGALNLNVREVCEESVYDLKRLVILVVQSEKKYGHYGSGGKKLSSGKKWHQLERIPHKAKH